MPDDLIVAAARALAIASDVDPNESADVLGNKLWSWYVDDVRAVLAAVAPILREQGARAMQEAAAGTALRTVLAASLSKAVWDSVCALDPATIAKGIGDADAIERGDHFKG